MVNRSQNRPGDSGAQASISQQEFPTTLPRTPCSDSHRLGSTRWSTGYRARRLTGAGEPSRTAAAAGAGVGTTAPGGGVGDGCADAITPLDVPGVAGATSVGDSSETGRADGLAQATIALATASRMHLRSTPHHCRARGARRVKRGAVHQRQLDKAVRLPDGQRGEPSSALDCLPRRTVADRRGPRSRLGRRCHAPPGLVATASAPLALDPSVAACRHAPGRSDCDVRPTTLLATQRAVDVQACRSRGLVGSGELPGDRFARAQVHLIRGLTPKRRMRDLPVVQRSNTMPTNR